MADTDEVVSIPAVSGTVRSGPCRYLGFSVRETTDTTRAVLRIRRGGAAGDILDVVSLAAGESARENYESGDPSSDGYSIGSGQDIYVDFVSGAGNVEGSVRVHGGS